MTLDTANNDASFNTTGSSITTYDVYEVNEELIDESYDRQEDAEADEDEEKYMEENYEAEEEDEGEEEKYSVDEEEINDAKKTEEVRTQEEPWKVQQGKKNAVKRG